MHPHVTRIVPDVLGLELQTEAVRSFLPMLLGMASFITTTTNIAADQTYPEIFRRITYATKVGHARAERLRVRIIWIVRVFVWRGVCGTADGTAGTFPSLQTGAVEDMLT